MAYEAKDKFFVAIDVDTLDDAKKMMDSLVGLVNNVKIGLQLATRDSWMSAIDAAHERGFKVFCDAKFKDIPNTMEHAAYSLTQHKPEYFTVMADNSSDALSGVRSGVDRASNELKLPYKPKIIAVTVLTSIGLVECMEIYGGDLRLKTKYFGDKALAAGLDAIVCSPNEIEIFRSDDTFNETLIITPGVRPSWSTSNDQNRIATPADAIRRGADMLVIGRPITQPPKAVGSIQEAVKRIIMEIEEASIGRKI